MSHADHRVVAFTPFGRESTVTILCAYMERDHEAGILDEWQLWMNTDPTGQERDIEYAHELAEHFDWVTLKELPEGVIRESPKQLNTGSFYRYTTDPGTIYLRFDDDIVYVHPDAIPNMVDAKVNQPGTLACFPIIWNNAICSWHLQARGVIPREYGVVKDAYCMDPIGWADPGFATRIHNLLLGWIEEGTPEKAFMYQDVQLAPRQQFSVSCFAVDGEDYAALDPPGALNYGEEEHWLTVHHAENVGKTNVILGNALVSHLTFYPQRVILRNTNILDRYRRIAMGVEATTTMTADARKAEARAKSWAKARA